MKITDGLEKSWWPAANKLIFVPIAVKAQAFGNNLIIFVYLTFMNQHEFNQRLRQALLLMVIIAIGILLVAQLSSFIPGFLDGITLYILSRSLYYKLK